LSVIEGDITGLQVDAVVNAANERLAGGGGVDGAIHRAAGYDQLQAACRALGGCPTGQVKVTPGFNLPAKYIFHAVGPVWRGGDHNEEALLASCYRNALRLAEDYGISSIAFPAISCGVYGYPVRQAVHCAVSTVVQYLQELSLRQGARPIGAPAGIQVIFCCFSGDVAQVL
jgi:Predicted phosphatase homologous to the C-terminal domain of histone macroH2A1